MDQPNYLIATFPSAKSAEPFTQVLAGNGIKFEVGLKKSPFDPSFAFNKSFDWVEVKIPESEKSNAKRVLNEAGIQLSDDSTETVYTDYLLEFQDEELMDVMYKQDEWSKSDVKAAEEILRNRGIYFNEEEKKALFKKRIEEIRKPKRTSVFYIVTGFILALVPGFGALLGMAIGGSWYFVQRKDPLGGKYYVFDDYSRKWGLGIMITGIVVMLLVVLGSILEIGGFLNLRSLT